MAAGPFVPKCLWQYAKAKRSSILVLTFRKKDGKPVWRFVIKNNTEQFFEQVNQSNFLQTRNDWTTQSSSVLRFNVESGVDWGVLLVVVYAEVDVRGRVK